MVFVVIGLTLELFTGVGGSQDYYTIKSGVFVHNSSVRPLVNNDGVNVREAQLLILEFQEHSQIN